MRALRWILLVLVSALTALALWNYLGVHRPVAQRLAQDERNTKVKVWAYHRQGVQPSTIVFDMRSIDPQAAQLDVMRALFQAAEALKGSRYERVVLSYAGTPKFQLDGAYFQQLGEEFATQNPIYTVRTLPQNVHKLDGTPAFGTWTGGMLGVLGKQMEDVTQFSRDWYVDDMARSLKRQ